MAFLKKSLIILFALLSCGFLFYVFYTQVVQPIAFPAANPPDIVDIPQLVLGYLQKLKDSL